MKIRDRVWEKVGRLRWRRVWVRVEAQVRDRVGIQVPGPVEERVWARVGDQIRAQAREGINV